MIILYAISIDTHERTIIYIAESMSTMKTGTTMYNTSAYEQKTMIKIST